MKKKLTPAKGRIYFCIRAHIQRTGASPSYQEIMTACGLKSSGSVHAAIDVLVRDGWLVRGDKYSARTLSLPKPKRRVMLDEAAAEWLARGMVVVGYQCADGTLVELKAWQNRDGQYVRVDAAT